MQFLNLGLPRSGLESVRTAMAILGIHTRPKKPFTHRDWLDRITDIELLQGHPFSSDYRRTIVTLQSISAPPVLFYTYRPLEEWLASCERTHNNIPNDAWECQGRQQFFGSIVFDRYKYQQIWHLRLATAQNIPACRIIPMDAEDHVKWDLLEDLIGPRKRMPFPHDNKSRPLTPLPYHPNELVA